jgi:hypothetical protein
MLPACENRLGRRIQRLPTDEEQNPSSRRHQSVLKIDSKIGEYGRLCQED